MRKRTNNNNLRKRIFLTIFMLLLTRIGGFIPLPGVVQEALYESVSNNSTLNFVNILTGGSSSCIGIFALGIIPYINASVVLQLATNFIPTIERLQKEEGEFGKQLLIQITRYITFGLSIVQGLLISFWIRPYVFNWNILFIVETILALSAGGMIIMWLSEQITEKGIGNGTSLLISMNILSGLPKLIYLEFTKTTVQNGFLEGILILILFSIIIFGIIFIQEGTKRIPIVSARQLRKGRTEIKTSYLPLRLNPGGVMPIIFASTCASIPNSLRQFITDPGLLNLLDLVLSIGKNRIVSLLCYLLLILIFSFLYSSFIINSEDIAKNLKKMECSIPGVRPGKTTSNYLQKTLNTLTFLGALFLTLIAIIPTIIESMFGLSIFKGLGGTSLLILVGVIIDTIKQIQTYTISKRYQDMMKNGVII